MHTKSAAVPRVLLNLLAAIPDAEHDPFDSGSIQQPQLMR
jgi:hypothetical protein